MYAWVLVFWLQQIHGLQSGQEAERIRRLASDQLEVHDDAQPVERPGEQSANAWRGSSFGNTIQTFRSMAQCR